MIVYVVSEIIHMRAGVYFGPDKKFDAPIYGNSTATGGEEFDDFEGLAAPLRPSNGELYFADTCALESDWWRSPFYHFMFAGSFQFVLFCCGILGTSRAGWGVSCVVAAALTFVTGGLYTESETIWANDGNRDDEDAAAANGLILLVVFGVAVFVLPAIALFFSEIKRKAVLFLKMMIFTIFFEKGTLCLEDDDLSVKNLRERVGVWLVAAN